MSEISEECYSAGWMHGPEYKLWDIINGKTGKNTDNPRSLMSKLQKCAKYPTKSPDGFIGPTMKRTREFLRSYGAKDSSQWMTGYLSKQGATHDYQNSGLQKPGRVVRHYWGGRKHEQAQKLSSTNTEA